MAAQRDMMFAILAVVPGKLFADIVKNLPDAAVHVEADEENAVITCDTASFSIKALNPDDFPAFPHVDVTQRVDIPFAQFASMVRRVARVVSKDESRAILTGVLITIEDGRLKMVATDSYRLAITEAELPEYAGEEFQAVIAGTFLQDIAALPKTDGPVSFALAENQIVVTYQDTVFVNRRIEGNFPNYRQLLPDSHSTRVSMPVEHLVAGVKRATLLGQASSPVRFDINIASLGAGDHRMRRRGRGRGDSLQLRLPAGRPGRRGHRRGVPGGAVVAQAGHLQGRRAGELPVPRHAGAHRLGAPPRPFAPWTCASNA